MGEIFEEIIKIWSGEECVFQKLVKIEKLSKDRNVDVMQTAILWKLRKTMIEMCGRRGYDIDHRHLTIELLDFSEGFQRTASREELSFEVEHLKYPNVRICVFFLTKPLIKKEDIEVYYNASEVEDMHHLIFVVLKRMADCAKKFIAEVADTCRIEYFTEIELMTLVGERTLKWEHYPMTPQMQKNHFICFGVKESWYPPVKADTLESRYWGLQRGQVVKSVRYLEEGGGRFVAYHFVV